MPQDGTPGFNRPSSHNHGRQEREGSRSPAKEETAAFGCEASGKGRFGGKLSTEASPASISCGTRRLLKALMGDVTNQRRGNA